MEMADEVQASFCRHAWLYIIIIIFIFVNINILLYLFTYDIYLSSKDNLIFSY